MHGNLFLSPTLLMSLGLRSKVTVSNGFSRANTILDSFLLHLKMTGTVSCRHKDFILSILSSHQVFLWTAVFLLSLLAKPKSVKFAKRGILDCIHSIYRVTNVVQSLSIPSIAISYTLNKLCG